MDDLYANAWGESTNTELKDLGPDTSWKPDPSPTRKSSHQVLDEPEVKWTPAAAPVSWTPDVDPIPKPLPLWVQPLTSDIWGSNSQQTPFRSSSPPSQPGTPSILSSPSPSNSTSEEQHTAISEVHISASPPSHSRSPSPDIFGTFESGDRDNVSPHAEEDGWGSSLPAYDTPDISSSPWANDASRKPQVQEAGDEEWETAKRQKEQLDKKMPPEVLANIIDNFHGFIQETLPDLDKIPPDEDWMKGWRNGLGNVEGLDTLVNTIIPEHRFSPRVQFGKTSIAKDMSKSLRLSKHLPLTRMSPMSHFMLSKGSSTDWEAAVKNRSDVIPDDMPAGWRIVEKKEEPVPNVDTRVKKAGIFSFWGRRGLSTSTETKQPLIPDSPNDISSPPPLPQFASISPINPVSRSPRQSEEVRRSISTSDRPPTLLSMALPATAPSSSSKAENSTVDPVDFSTPDPAPSAVSRFLNRFSRPKNSTSPRDSTALSSDDLDFFSESIPSATDDPDEDDVPLAQKKVAVDKGPGVLLPTLPPPPTSTTMVFDGGNTYSRPEFPTDNDDFAPFFDAPALIPSSSDVEPLKNSSVPSIGSRSFPTAGVPVTRGSNPAAIKDVRSSASPSPVNRGGNPLTPLKVPPPPLSRSQTPPHFPFARMSSSINQQAPVPFLIPPPPSSRSTTPALSSLPTHSTAIPQISTIRPTSPPSYTTKSLTSTFDDDEFSDFLSSESSSARQSYTNLTPTMDFQFMLTSTVDKHPLMAGASPISPLGTTNFGDFDQFTTPLPQTTKSSPRPPPPPAKSKPSKPPAISMSDFQPRRAANHSHTLNLLETAAARKGQWPAPPSPLPIALTPPPLPSVRSNTSIALLDTVAEPSSTLKTSELQRSVVSPMGPSDTGFGFKFMDSSIGFGAKGMAPFSQKPLPPPSQSLMDFGDFESSTIPAVQAKPLPVDKVVNGVGEKSAAGGLSAQDLLFFEGL